jgi:hypothetical protein
MNIQSANTEPFYVFHRFAEALNRRVKCITAAIKFTKMAVGQGKAATKIMSALIEATGEPWGNLNHYDPNEELLAAGPFLAEMALVRADSAFEDFLESVQAEIHRLEAFKGEQTQPWTPPEAGDEETELSALRPSKLYDRHGWDWQPLKDELAVYQWFHWTRNSIVHRNGRLTASAIKTFAGADFQATWKKLTTARKKPPMTLPPFSGEYVELRPRDVVFFTSICRRIAAHLNEQLRAMLGEDGLYLMAAHHSLLREKPVDDHIRRRSPDVVVNHYLANRVRARSFPTSATPQILRRLKVWDRCRQRYEELSEQWAKQEKLAKESRTPSKRKPVPRTG